MSAVIEWRSDFGMEALKTHFALFHVFRMLKMQFFCRFGGLVPLGLVRYSLSVHTDLDIC